MIEMKPLHYFVAAYEERSVTSAATRCFVAQPSISYAIKSLESTLGHQLFVRSKQGLMPTEEGHKLYKLAVDLIFQNLKLKAAFTPNERIELRLFIQPDININHYQSIIQSLKCSFELLDLCLVETIEQAQIAIADEELVPSQFQFEVLKNEKYSLVVPCDHHLASESIVTLDQCDGMAFIERPYCSKRKLFERLLAQRGVSITYSGKANHDLQIQSLVRLGFGLAIVPESYLQKDKSLHTLGIAVEDSISRSITLAYRNIDEQIVEVIQSLSFDEFSF